MEDIQIYTLPNGIRIVHRQVLHTQISHIGLMLDMGSRDEKPHQQGLAHFWEHMAFKGTSKRSSLNIINRLEVVGGELNAYTTKEKICFHASMLTPHYERGLELLADITFNSIFPDKQLDKERGVILEEMSMYYDSPEDAIQDDFDEIVFADHQLGRNILGNQDSVKNFKREDLFAFIDENLDTERIIFSSIGKMSFKEVIKLAEKYFKDIPHKKSDLKRVAPTLYLPQNVKVNRGITQAHVAIGRPAYSLIHEKRLPFFMLTNLLGGPGMNSRLNLSVREKYGLVYSIDAGYTPYIDTGFLGIYFGTEPKQLNKALSLIMKELKILRETALTTTQLHNTKEQLMGQLAMSEEGNMSFMLMMAKSLLDINRIDSLESIFSQISAVSADQLKDLANEMFIEDQLSTLTFLPEN
ncbi:Predicted Zn-dependent peptidase [Pseudarcicella hirudinis]|uniref:Predicted Zn-dependent peptidase n=1 Tax=Pseudarcicella hirudinis TaxID=1079859 RepID=A0A1I5PMY9_9BACT|nr:pitrilysin family protein [Pseudarcicella hirudinis]SFP35150.1 Predicted Zn-dependent peptidase [Pseudarcicella hirudinis]